MSHPRSHLELVCNLAIGGNCSNAAMRNEVCSNTACFDSLFIDEGFGALDSNNLALAISTLERLQATGRQIGVISHVEELKERISVKIDVAPCGGGKSAVQILS